MRIYAENNSNYIKSMDTATEIRLQIVGHDNNLLDLTKFKSVKVVVGRRDNILTTDITPTKITANGNLHFTIPNNTLSSDKYVLEVHLTEENGKLRIAPNQGTFLLIVERSLGELQKEIVIMSDDVANDLKISNLENAEYIVNLEYRVSMIEMGF